jgi:hypothetical protein
MPADKPENKERLDTFVGHGRMNTERPYDHIGFSSFIPLPAVPRPEYKWSDYGTMSFTSSLDIGAWRQEQELGQKSEQESRIEFYQSKSIYEPERASASFHDDTMEQLKECAEERMEKQKYEIIMENVGIHEIKIDCGCDVCRRHFSQAVSIVKIIEELEREKKENIHEAIESLIVKKEEEMEADS